MADWLDRPNAPALGTVLCTVAELPDDNGVERVFGDGPDAFRVAVFRLQDGGVRAWLNECPHVHIPMQFSDGVFCVYEIEGQRDLMCAHHSAVFHIADGQCWDGPCRGEHLVPVDVHVVDGAVVVGAGARR